MRITPSESKHSFGISGKGLITSMGLKAKARTKNCKKERYAISNASNKDLKKIIRKFDKLTYKNYEKRRPKYEPTNSYFYSTRHLAKCMMRADSLNLHV